MATHSSVLAWRIPGTGEPGGLPSRVAQSWTRLKLLSSSSSSSKPSKDLEKNPIPSSYPISLRAIGINISDICNTDSVWSYHTALGK